MKTDGEKRQMVKTVKFSYWLILLLFCTKKQNNKKRLFVSIIWGEAVEGIKIYNTHPTKCPPPLYNHIRRKPPSGGGV